jgi:LAS superfamily LD-carboxypeptidase LdcB
MLGIFPKTAKFQGKMSFIPTSGYRSYEEQQRIENHLYKNGQEGLGTGVRLNALRAEEKKKGRRLKSGEYEHLPVATGTHGSGVALDVGLSGLNTMGDRKYLSAAFRHPMFQWLVDYGEKFGLIRPYLSAPYPIEW